MTANQRPAVLYTLAQGPIATYSVDLKCEAKCECTYYGDVPSIIHIGGHQTSMSNCACLYNVALSKGTSPPLDFPFGFEITGDHVWSGIVQLSLILGVACRETLAVVPTTKLSVVVTDSVTVGHPCCGVHNCHDPLLNNCDHFCLNHLPLVNTCTIIGCNHVVVSSMKTCDTPTHQAVEKAYTECGQAHFQFQEQLQRTFFATPPDSIPEEEYSEEEFQVVSEATTSQQPMARLRAQFGRKCTHNEQLIEMIKHVFCDETIKLSHIFYNNNCTLSYMVHDDPYFQNVGLSVDCQEHCNPAFFDKLKGDDNTWLFNSSIAEQTNVWFGGYHSICCEMIADCYTFFLDEMIIQKNHLLKVKLASQQWSPGNWPL
ncbi:hypothetical protein EDB19DRAFT_1897954 [Suillus lakei]|nr:hypothetical protein EDB19DRAFT_1897954 [Suillus lakei]